MGKVRVKTFDESGEALEDKKVKARQEAKKSQVAAETKEADKHAVAENTASAPDRVKTHVSSNTKQSSSKRHQANLKNVDKTKHYALPEAIEVLKKFKKGSFDETVELHINVTEKSVSGNLTLPHGTGKKLRIVVADDAVIDDVSKGKIDFDVLVAKPEQMPKLAKVARILGPRGLMPNPKAGTVTNNPQEVIDKLSAGQVTYKTEPQNPIIHMSVGKVSFENEKLAENIKTVLTEIGASKINQVVLKSTMSPGIKLAVK